MILGTPYEAHLDPADYLAALRDPARIPVLGEAGRRLEELAELSDPGTAPPPGPSGAVLVSVPPGSAAEPVAGALAQRVDGTFVACAPRELPEVATVADHVILAGLADELSLDLMIEALEATSALRRSGRGEAALGVLLGRSLEELSWLIAKGLGCGLRVPPDDPQLCLAPWGARARQDIAGLRWVVGAEARADVVAPLLSDRRHGLVSFAVAGNEHGLVLSDTVVCGAGVDRIEKEQTPAGAPSCVFSGQCFRPGVGSADVLLAREVRADVVFTNSCMSWRPGHGLAAADYQLTNAFASGIAAAYIGAVHRMVPDVRLNRLVHQAAAAGAGAGQIAVLLNERAACREVPYYLLLGLPWVAPVPGAVPVRLDRLAALTGRTGPSPDDAARKRLRHAGRAIQALRDLPLIGLPPAGDLVEIDARMGAAVAALKGDPSVVREDAEGDPVERVLELVAAAQFDVALDLHDFGLVSESSLNEVWEDFLETKAVPGVGRCPYCGGPTAIVTGRHPAYPQLERELNACHTCGPVLDLPVDSAVRAITIDCPTTWPRPGTVEVEVTITAAAAANGSEPVPAVVVVQVAKSVVHGLVVPGPQRVLFEPGGAARVRARIQVEPCAFAHHEHVVRAAVVVGGRVHSTARPVAVRPP